MRRRRLRQTKEKAQRGDLPLHEARVQRAAACADKKGASLGQVIGTIGEIISNRLAHRRQHWNEALFAALAGNREHFAERRLCASKSERLRKPQPATIEERENCGIALALPSARRQFAGGSE